MHEILTIGSAVIDVFITSGHFVVNQTGETALLCQTYGEKVEVESMNLCAGGGASNTAIGFTRAGSTAALITELGKDVFSQIITDTLHTEFVRTNFLIQQRKEQTGGSVIMVGKDGGRTIMVYRGASSQLDPSDISETAIMRAEWIHLSSISGRLETLREIGRFAHQGNKNISWNPGRGELELLSSGQLSLDTLPVSVLFMNYSEWMMVGELHDQLRRTIPEIIITNGGKNGVLYRGTSDANTLSFSPLPAQVVDETGAGDAFAVGYVTAKRHGESSDSAIQWALRNSQSVVQHIGATAGLLSLERLSGV